jgi:hypothetical protein
MTGRAGGKRTIALLDSLAILDTHSIFFAGLAARGHKLTYTLATSPRVTLFEYGQPLYDNVVYFAPTTTAFTAPGLEGSQTLADFVAQGGNLIMAADVDMSDLTREMASEFGVDFDKKRTVVMDHFSHAPALDLKGMHTNVVSSNLIENEKILGPVAGRKGGAAPVVFRGVGHIVDPENILAVPILSGMSSTYSAAPLKEIPAPSLASARLTNAGTTLGLISGVQGRNNARATISGSLDFFSDAYFQHTLDTTGQLAGNELVALEISKWAFGERGILRASNVTHHRADGWVMELEEGEKGTRSSGTGHSVRCPSSTNSPIMAHLEVSMTFLISPFHHSKSNLLPYLRSSLPPSSHQEQSRALACHQRKARPALLALSGPGIEPAISGLPHQGRHHLLARD